jgi:hypothetical protein
VSNTTPKIQRLPSAPESANPRPDHASDQRKEITMPTNNEAALILSSLFITEGLKRSLLELVRLKGDDGLAWLTEFQGELVRDSKCSGVDGVPIEDEATIMRNALQMLDFVFDGIRREIGQKPENS